MKKKYESESTEPSVMVNTVQPAKMVRLVNTAVKPEPRDITLRDGTNLRLAAYHPQQTGHISPPILKKLVPLQTKDGKASAVAKMIKRGEIVMEEVS